MRLDSSMVDRGLANSRSQAENIIKLGQVKVDGKLTKKPSKPVKLNTKIELTSNQHYVSRAAFKLASVVKAFDLDFRGKTVLDVGSSTGGFTEFAINHGATKVIAVEVGTNQLHPRLRNNPKIELHEQTDIRNFSTNQSVDIVLIDVSFISLQDILPTVRLFANKNTSIVAMVKPQFEAFKSDTKHKGVIKNEKIRRDILKNFEQWAKQHFFIKNKADSSVAGAKGNIERFYLLIKL
ncbi:MAG: TlyA family RNA methyltransferase [Patescibacteria group bacterium]